MSFLTMQQHVLNRSRQSGTWATDRVKEYLNLCQQELYALHSVDWKCLEKQSTAACVVGQKDYALPTDFVRALHLQLETGTVYTTIKEFNWDYARELLNEYTTNSLPEVYSIHYQQLYLSPAPDLTYTMRLDYIYKPSDMSDNSDTPPADEWEMILEEGALGYLFRDLHRPEESQISLNRYEQMKAQYADAQNHSPDKDDSLMTNWQGVSSYYE